MAKDYVIWKVIIWHKSEELFCAWKQCILFKKSGVIPSIDCEVINEWCHYLKRHFLSQVLNLGSGKFQNFIFASKTFFAMYLKLKYAMAWHMDANYGFLSTFCGNGSKWLLWRGKIQKSKIDTLNDFQWLQWFFQQEKTSIEVTDAKYWNCNKVNQSKPVKNWLC